MNKLILIPPPVFALALFAIGYGLDLLFPALPRPHLPLLGFILMASGLALGLMALAHFRLRRTTPIPHGEPSALVLSGPYLWTRNPMYLGLFTALLGLACYLGGLPLLLAAPGFCAVVNRIHIPHEEAKLAGLFGADYAAFRDRIPRWL
ncbi:Protein-S-isoprenylcysteine O-methyltransferase Ste14 [Methylomagnum ishizawai]|uniref:Protein-S-isoprenylcysteine O-methyltransferase Ste14 n=1 Tax=Methylomagnum ishizawai TaxID=1760988 RepID=A0A1Y6D1T6_9GAMM|nr:isoprenylcysteine carboxylmethyltransferase family protein [Methylomagnum ishizawai]SMF96370.1 Protein-S-isoprenylcysteine O-methyltransferase Ste14 [Methylomagnum ishizawai]